LKKQIYGSGQYINIIFCAFFIFISLSARAQYGVTTLGIELKPIIPSDLFAVTNQPLLYNNNRNTFTKTFTIQPQLGYSGGATIRIGLSKLWTVESGIYYSTREYRSHLYDDSSKISVSDKFKFENYEMPFLGLIYVRLSKDIYLNNAFGVALDFFPYDIETPNNGYYSTRIAREYWVLPALMANVGAEYRTKDKGYFYFGFLYHRMLLPMGHVGFFFNDTNGAPEFVAEEIQGHYFAVDLKYFFPNNRTPILDYGF